MASSRNTHVAGGKKAPAKPAPKPWTIADDKASTSYVDRILGIRGDGAADVAGKHTKDTLASTVQTLRGYNERYGYCTENELAHMWYLDKLAKGDENFQKKFQEILEHDEFSRDQKIKMAYATLEKKWSTEEKEKLRSDRRQINEKFAQKTSVAVDEEITTEGKKQKHEKIIKICKNADKFYSCVNKTKTAQYKINEKDLQDLNASMGTQIDLMFIVRHENGGNMSPALQGYVPWGEGASKSNSSGVTIATGFDLGAHNEFDLQRMGFKTYPDLYKKLKKYLRLQQQDACNKLAEDMLANEPFTVTEEEAREIDRLVFKDKMSQFQKNWDKAVVKGGKKFAELDPRQQTVLASRAYQQGPNWMESQKLSADMKAFKDAALKGDWITAQKCYEAAYNLKIERYKQESNLLSGALSDISKKIPEKK